jgi:hypothetical protein
MVMVKDVGLEDTAGELSKTLNDMPGWPAAALKHLEGESFSTSSVQAFAKEVDEAMSKLDRVRELMLALPGSASKSKHAGLQERAGTEIAKIDSLFHECVRQAWARACVLWCDGIHELSEDQMAQKMEQAACGDEDDGNDAVASFAALAGSFKDLKPKFSKCGAAASASLCHFVTQMFQTLRDVKQLAAEMALTKESNVTEVQANAMLAQLKRAKTFIFSDTVKHNYLAMLRKTLCTEGAYAKMEEHIASISEDAVTLKVLLVTVYMLKVPLQEELERTMSPENTAKHTSGVKHVKRDIQAALLQLSLSAVSCTGATCIIPVCSGPIDSF